MTAPQQTTARIRGEPVASFGSYAQAQRAVDYLSDNGFPVENISIVGSDLKQVERVLGRLTKWKAALAGAESGAWIGALIGLLLSLFANPGTGVVLILLWGVLYGAVFGSLWGFIAHLFTFGQRDFSTFGITVATRYDAYCVREQAARAAEMLIQMPSRSTG